LDLLNEKGDSDQIKTKDLEEDTLPDFEDFEKQMANEILNDSKNSNEDDNMQMFVIKADEVLNSQGDYEEEDDKQAIEELKLVFGDMSMDGKTSKEGDQRVDYVEEENMFRDMSEQEKAQVVEKFDMLVKKGQSYNYINKNDDYKDP
jgi:hypothetical protein